MLFGTGGTVSLSVTSRLMSARLCSRKAESVYDVRCCKTREYDGFAGGEFVDPEAAGALAKELLTATAEETRPRTKTVYVGVPGEFGMSVCRDVSVMLDRSRRIVDADTAYLAEKGRGAAEDGYLFIGDSPVCYRVDASGGSYFDVRGMKPKLMRASGLRIKRHASRPVRINVQEFIERMCFTAVGRLDHLTRSLVGI